MRDDFDVIIIGGGHAGAEAAWAATATGAAVALVTLDPAKIGQMSCNPAIGGLAKGQIAREVDALGGLMGHAADATGIQFRMLNASKGEAVRGPRCQSDKYRYAEFVREKLAGRDGLTIVGGEVAELFLVPCPSSFVDPDQEQRTKDKEQAGGVRLADGRTLTARALVLTTGTFMRGLMHTGDTRMPGGRAGEAAASGISGELLRLGFDLGRLKTGTPPRLRAGTIDWSAFEEQPGDDRPMPFSFLNEYAGGWRPPLRQVPCHIGHTTPAAHEVIRQNLHRAPMFTGQIESAGPRYCPSIEDKIHRFADKPRHQVFLEPESLDTDEVYCNGISTSLPADVQAQMLRLIPGLDRAEVIRFGYAVEYDMVWPKQIWATLESKPMPGLFLAGQINGTSGYEEAAGQGWLAGINAARLAAGQELITLGRDEAYIGVMVDDLTTTHPIEPYRMFTSRAEHRLLLRADNADERLTPIGRWLGTVDGGRWQQFENRRAEVAAVEMWLATAKLDGKPAADWLRQPGHDWQALVAADPAARQFNPTAGRLAATKAKYAGYIDRQQRDIARLDTLEHQPIPRHLDYAAVAGLRTEARQRLIEFTPGSLGQARRLSGITPADVSLLAVHLTRSRGQ